MEAVEQTTATETATATEVTAMTSENLEAAAQEPSEETPVEQAAVEKAEPAVQEPSEVEKVKQEVEKLKKQLTDKDAYIRNRESVIGQQNQQLTQLKQQADTLRTQAKDNFHIDPAESTRLIYQAEKVEEQAKGIEFQQQWDANKQSIMQFVPDYQDLVNDIAEIITERGYPPQMVERFKARPWDEPVHVAVPFAEAARARRQGRELQEKIKTLDKKPEEIAKNIAKAATQTPGITASTGGSVTDTTTITSSDISKMSKVQLDALLEKTK